jgi:predicted dehydrogenase
MLRAVIVGLGWWGRHIVRRMAGSPQLRILRAVDAHPEAAAEFAREHDLPLGRDLDEALRDPAVDAVILATPHSLHTAQVMAAAAAGKHVFCEKPLALTRPDAEAAVAACAAAGVLLGIGHERRFEPAMLEVVRLLRSGGLGAIMHLEANFSHDKLARLPATDWRASTSDAPAAGMTAMGIHLTDLFVHLLGPAREAFAMTSKRVLAAENGDVVSAQIRFGNGATAYLNAILATPLYLRFTVFGAKAWVEVRNDTHPDTPGPATLTLQRTGAPPDVWTYDWTDTVRTNLEHFAAAIAGGPAYPFSDTEKIANIALLEAICTSAASGRPATVA